MSKIKNINNDNLIFIGNEPRVDSRVISNGIGVEHRHTFRLISQYKIEMEKLGLMRFENAKGKIGRPEKYALLNEAQSIFLLTLSRNSDRVVDFKLNLTISFDKYRKRDLLLARQSERKAQLEYQQARAESKITRKEETDTIKKFVEYAFAQGSKNAKKYYVNITQMENKALFYFEQAIEKPNNLREWLDRMQLTQLAVAENLVNKILIECMDKGMYYKDIYKIIKEKVEIYATCIGKSPILLCLPEYNDNKLLAIHNSN